MGSFGGDAQRVRAARHSVVVSQDDGPPRSHFCGRYQAYTCNCA